MESATTYTAHTAEVITDAKEATGLNIEVKYWNNQHHVLVNSRHVYAASETNCQSFLEGMILTAKLIER